MNETLLLVEDEKIVALLEQKELKSRGYTVKHAATAEDAVNRGITDNEIELILMDIDLGGDADGTEVARRILAVRDIPIIFLSSHTEAAIVELTEKISSYGYVVKNTGITILDASIKMAFKLFSAKQNEKRKENELRISETRYRDILESMNLIAVQIDTDGHVTYCNDHFCKLIGWNREQILGKEWFSTFIPEELRSSLKREVFQSALNHDANALEFINDILTSSGERKKIHWSNSVRFNIRDEIIGVTSVGIDISDKAKADQLINESEQRFHHLFNAIDDAIFIYTADSPFLEVNDAACRTLGYSREELLTLKPEDIDDESDRKRIAERMKAVLHSGEINFQVMHLTKSGETFPVDIHSKVIRYKGQLSVLSVARDISEQQRYENRLKASEEKFSKAFYGGPLLSSISSVDDGKYIEVNDNFVNTTGYSRQDAIGTTSVNLGFISAEDRDRLKSILLARGKVEALELNLRRKSGEPFTCLYYGEIISVAGSQKLLSLAQDLTEQKAMQAQIGIEKNKLTQLMATSPVSIAAVSPRQSVRRHYYDDGKCKRTDQEPERA